jgi:Na+-translocating ferredoxin:NAD+ oxidoreductase RNF subunit RnfB
VYEPTTQFAAVALFMGSLGVGLAIILVIAHRRFYVYEDPRIEQVEALLPRSNCGACGTAGCRAFAEALVGGSVKPGQCTVNSPDTNQTIAEFLGVELGAVEKRVARVACAGGNHVAWIRAHYEGLPSCRAAALVAGGGKGCAWGCLGLGDCESVCEFDAILLDCHGLPHIESAACTACGDCVTVCPKSLISLQPVSHQLWIACKNQEHGDLAEAQCEVACNACGRCVLDAPEGLITMKNDLAEIDYSKNAIASTLPIERCPTGAIVWITENELSYKGRAAKPIIRHQPLPLAM